MIDEEAFKKLLEAGRIGKIVREEAARKAKPGMKLIELAEYIENRIRELGGEPAFPVNLSINETAAHYAPVVGDETVIPDSAVLKIDLGAHVDGYISDTAVTVSFDPAYDSLLEASRSALENALEYVKPGVRAKDVGKVIEDTIRSMGYRPIKNLTGHSIDRYVIHSGRSIPNYADPFARWKFTDGVYAIEPFVTNGVGLVEDGPLITIYSLIPKRKLRASLRELKLYRKIWSERRTLPFCERWYADMYNNIEELRGTLRLMMNHGLVYGYPILIEKSRGMVAQFEHTFVIYNGEVYVTTR
jgi:methionyl aminopeptidase